MSRGDIDKIIWQYPRRWDGLCDINSYKKRTEWIMKADRLFFEEGRYALPNDDEILSNAQFTNYLSFAHAADISVQLISAFFSKTIQFIYNRTFYEELCTIHINDLEMCLLGFIYEKASKYYTEYNNLNSGWRDNAFG